MRPLGESASVKISLGQRVVCETFLVARFIRVMRPRWHPPTQSTSPPQATPHGDAGSGARTIGRALVSRSITLPNQAPSIHST